MRAGITEENIPFLTNTFVGMMLVQTFFVVRKFLVWQREHPSNPDTGDDDDLDEDDRATYNTVDANKSVSFGTNGFNEG